MTANDLTLTHTRPAIGDDVSLWTDHNRRRRIALESPEDFIDLLCDRFPLVPRSYVALYLERTIVEHHIENPLIERYLEAELGSIAKYRELIRGFAAQGFQIAGQSVLDIGCSNGALPLACLGEGAASAMGIDVSPGRLDSAAVL